MAHAEKEGIVPFWVQPIMMNIEGFRVVRDSDEAYRVTDARFVVLGHVVRFLASAADGKGYVWTFRAFGEDFPTLRSAVAEFAKIRGVVRFDAMGEMAS